MCGNEKDAELVNMLIFTIMISSSFHIWQATQINLLLNVCVPVRVQAGVLFDDVINVFIE